jgi:hypothetical protein
MATTQGVLGLDTELKIGDAASPENFTLIPDIFGAIDGPEIAQQYVDFTHMQSTGGFEESKASFKSPGQVTFTCHYIADNTYHEKLVTNATANPATLTNFECEYPDGTVIAFSAYVSVKFNSDTKGKFTMAVTLKLEGSFTVGNPSP